MKKMPTEPTTRENLEAKFDRGEDVLDYFDVEKAEAIPPRNRAQAQYLVELPATKGTLVREASRSKYAKANETPGSPKKGEFMDVKSDGKPFKGVAKEPDKRRK